MIRRSQNPDQYTLYTTEQRLRRDRSHWTKVQGVLALVQFVIFLISLLLVLRYLATGEGFWLASVSIIIKTGILYTIMVTGSIWEKEVFGQYLFARPFFWEDVVSILVMILHTAYLMVFIFGLTSSTNQMIIALVAYSSYLINAIQFLYKLRLARLQGQSINTDKSMIYGAAQ